MAKGEHGLGAAFDGDGDRNMILGKVWNLSISSDFADSKIGKAYHQILPIQISPSLTKVDLNIIFFVKDAFFVTPCDSLAVLADNLEHIPWFKVSLFLFLLCH